MCNVIVYGYFNEIDLLCVKKLVADALQSALDAETWADTIVTCVPSTSATVSTVPRTKQFYAVIHDTKPHDESSVVVRTLHQLGLDVEVVQISNFFPKNIKTS